MITNTKDNKMKKLSLTAKGILVATTIWASAISAEETKVVEKAFTVKDGTGFKIENINGRVDIEKSNTNQIEIIATISAKSARDIERIQLVMEQSGNDVNIETKYKNSDWGNNNNSGKVEYQIKLPSQVTDSEVDLVNGSLVLENVSGTFDVDLVNGSIEATDLNGDSDLNSVNGSVELSYLSLDKVNKINVDTVNGSIKVRLPTDANIKIDAETMHGNIRNDFGLTVEKSLFSGRHMKGEVGDASTKLSLESVNGSIKILHK